MKKTLIVVLLLVYWLCPAISIAEQQPNPQPNPLYNGNWEGAWKVDTFRRGKAGTAIETTMKISVEDTGILKIIYWIHGQEPINVIGKVWKNDGNSIRIKLSSESSISMSLTEDNSIRAELRGLKGYPPLSTILFRQK